MGSGYENPLSWSFEAWLRNTRRTGKCKEQTICQMESFWLKEFIWMSDSRPHFTFPSWRAQWSYFFFRPNTKWERHLFWIHKSHQPFLFPVNLRALTEASRLWTRQSHPNFKNCSIRISMALLGEPAPQPERQDLAAPFRYVPTAPAEPPGRTRRNEETRPCQLRINAVPNAAGSAYLDRASGRVEVIEFCPGWGYCGYWLISRLTICLFVLPWFARCVIIIHNWIYSNWKTCLL